VQGGRLVKSVKRLRTKSSAFSHEVILAWICSSKRKRGTGQDDSASAECLAAKIRLETHQWAVLKRPTPDNVGRDLLSGGKNSYIAASVERHSRFLLLIKVAAARMAYFILANGADCCIHDSLRGSPTRQSHALGLHTLVIFERVVVSICFARRI
jgi:hypothetical protein